MPHDLSIRTATRDDLPALLELYRHLIPDEYDLDIEQAADIWERFSRDEGSVIHVGLLDGVPISTCTLIVVPNLTRGGVPYALIENVVTHSDHRGRGYGKSVIEAAVAKAWDHGCYKVMLLTGSKDPATLGFYDRAGFQRTKTGFEKRRLPPREI